MAPHSSTLPGKSHGRRSLVGCSPRGREELDTTERLHFHFSLSCVGEGKGNPLQCSCLENPREGGAWWLPSVGSHRVGHDWSDLAAAAAAAHSYSVCRFLLILHRMENWGWLHFTSLESVCVCVCDSLEVYVLLGSHSLGVDGFFVIVKA